MNTITNLDMPPNTTNASSLFARGVIIAGKQADRWSASASDISKPIGWRKSRHAQLMSDLFHRDVPFDFIDKVFAVMALCPQHTFQILTKRPERMAEYLAGIDDARRHYINEYANSISEPPDNDCAYNAPWPLPNVWLGTSCEDQAAADERIPHLLNCPAAVRFLSCEPLIGQITFPDEWLCSDEKCAHQAGVTWTIVGGESGPGARPCDVAWILSIIEQCKAAGVPCFVKQVGARPLVGDLEDGIPWTEAGAKVDYEYETGRIMLTDPKGGAICEWPENLRVRQWPEARA